MCNQQTESVLIVLRPTLIICGFTQIQTNACYFDKTQYPQLTQYLNTAFIPFYSGDTLLYCIAKETWQADETCIKYRNLQLQHKWDFNDRVSAELFDFDSVRDQIVSETVGSYCQICPRGQSKQLLQVASTGYSYVGCQAGSTCLYYQTQNLTNTFQGKCIFGYCPVGSCLNPQLQQCTTSTLKNCNRCEKTSIGSQICNECQAGFYVNNGSCIQRTQTIDTQNRFLSPIPVSFLTNSDFNIYPGYTIDKPAYSMHQILHEMINLLNNNTYSSANFNIYVFKGTHYLISCTGSTEELKLFNIYPELTDFCDKLKLKQIYASIDQIRVAIVPLGCNLKSQFGFTTTQGTLFDSVCINYSKDPNPTVIVNNQYSYLNITGSWAFYNLTFDGANSMVSDKLGLSDYSIIPYQLCGVVSEPTGYDGLLDIQDVGDLQLNTSLTYQCKDSYTPRQFPRKQNYKCFENQGHRVKQSVESTLRCGRIYDESDYFFQSQDGVYTKRQKTLFNLYEFATYQSVNVSVPQLSIQGCTFQNFYGQLDTLINIEMGSLSRTTFNGRYFYFYSGQYTAGAISIQSSTFKNSRFCRGAVYFRKMTYDIDYSMSLTNLTLLNLNNNTPSQLQYQYAYFNNINVTNLNSFTEVTALARYDKRRVYEFLNSNVYQPVMLMRPLHVGIFLNLEDYPGSILMTNSVFNSNMHYISEFNNTLTFSTENLQINDFIEEFGGSSEKAEYKMTICDEHTNQSKSLFGHAFKGEEGLNIDQYYDIFERLSLIYISRNWGLMYFNNNQFTNNVGTFGGAISINTPLFSKNWYVLPEIYIYMNTFTSNFGYLGGGAVYLRFAMNKTTNQGCGDGVWLQSSSFSANLVSKLGNGGALSAYCLFVDQTDQLEAPSTIIVNYSYEIDYPSPGKSNINLDFTMAIPANDDEIFQQSQGIFTNLPTKTTFLTLYQCEFFFNMGGNNGSAAYFFQVTYPAILNNTFESNKAMSSWWERLCSPFFFQLTQGVPFTFMDENYGYIDDYEFIVDEAFNNTSTGIPMRTIKNLQIDKTQVRGAVHIYLCQDSYCLQSMEQQSLIYLTYFIDNSVGPQFYTTYYEDMTSSLYISGGKQHQIQNCQFNNHQSNYISCFDWYQGYSFYDLLFNQTRYSQGSIFSIIMNYNLNWNQFVQTEMTIINPVLQLCNFSYNSHQQIINPQGASDQRYYRGQLIKWKTNQEGITKDALETIFMIQQCWFDTAAQPYKPSPDGGAIWYNYYYDIQSFEGSIAYLYIANQQFFFIYNIYYKIQTVNRAAIVIQDREVLGRNLISFEYEMYTIIIGRVLYTFNDFVDKQRSSIVVYYGTQINEAYCIQEGTLINAQDLYGLIMFECFFFIGYHQSYYDYIYTFICTELQQKFLLQPGCPDYIFSPDEWFVVLQSQQPEVLYQIHIERVGDIYDQENARYYEDFTLRNTQNTIGLEFLNNLWYYYTFGPTYSNVTLIWNKASFYQLFLRVYQINNLGSINAINSHINYGSNFATDDEASQQAFFGYQLKQGSILQATQQSTFYFILGKMDFMVAYNNASFINVEDSFFYLNRSEIQQNNFFDSKLFYITGRSEVVVNNVYIATMKGSYQFIYSVGVDINNPINFTVINCQFLSNYDEASNFFYLYYTNFTSSNNIFSNLVASNVFQGFQSQLYFSKTNISCTSQSYSFIFDCNQNVLTGYFYISNGTNLTFESCIFNNIPGLYSTIINATGGTIAILNSQFLNCTVLRPQSGILSFQAMQQEGSVNIIGTSFIGNTRDIYSSNSKLIIQNNIFQNGQYFFVYADQSSLVFQRNKLQTLISPVQLTKSGVYCNCFNFTAFNNYFISLSAPSGGAIYFNQIQNGNGTCNIANNIFTSNSATYGGSVFIQGVASLVVDSNKFIHNQANSGGALYLDCLSVIAGLSDSTNLTYCRYKITNNVFDSNSASNQGGAIMQKTSIQIDYSYNVRFINNQANYGPNIAKYASIILITSLNKTELASFNQNTAYNESLQALNITSFTNYSSGEILNLQITLYDSYYQRVSADSVSQASLSTSIFGQDSAVINNSRALISNGQYIFENLQIFLNPGSNQTLQLTLFQLEVYNHIDEAPFAYDSIPIFIQARKCNLGEEWAQNNTCQMCGNNTYMLQDNLQNVTLCQACPTGGRCFGGNQIYAGNNYQKSDFVVDLFFACNVSGVCLAGNASYPNGLCSTGYQGKLCTQCSTGFTRQNQFECTPCQNIVQNVIQIVFLVILAIIYIAVMRSTSQAESKSSISELIKIITNHIQAFSSISMINFQFPEVIEYYFTISQKIYFFERLFQIDCFLNTSAIGIPVFYIKLILIGLLPAFLILANLTFWMIYYFVNKKETFTFISLLSKSINTLVIMLYVIHPTITQFVLQTFNCTNLDFLNRLASDYSIICYQDQHIFFIFVIALPSIIIWVIGIPLTFYLMTQRYSKTIKKRDTFDTTDIDIQQTEIEQKFLRNRFGLLLNGYNKGFHYWEVMIMARKTLILMTLVFFSTFWTEAQMLGVILIFIIYVLLQINIQPYIRSSINKIELISLLSLTVNLYVGLHYKAIMHANYEESETLNIFFLGFLIFPNVLFLYYWLYYLRMEAIRELFNREMYYIIPFLICRRFDKEMISKNYLQKTKKYQKMVQKILPNGGGLSKLQDYNSKLRDILLNKYAEQTSLNTLKKSQNQKDNNILSFEQLNIPQLQRTSTIDQKDTQPFSQLLEKHLNKKANEIYSQQKTNNPSIQSIQQSTHNESFDSKQTNPSLMQVRRRRTKSKKESLQADE